MDRKDESVKELLGLASNFAVHYLEEINHRGVAPSTEAVGNLALLDGPLPEGPSDPVEVLRKLNAMISPATLATAGSRFFGFVIGSALPITLAANWLAGAWDQNSAYYKVTPGTAHLEKLALDWLLDLFGLPAECGGAFVTGATMANFSALAAARNDVLRRADWNVEADGLIGAPPITVIVGAEAHPTLFKSLGLLGLGRNRLIKVPVDSEGSMRVAEFPAINGPTIVCMQAGNVNTGSFDPIGEVCDIAHSTGAWVHVDGAFGLWAIAVPALAHVTAGIAKADSWATDFHKWLNTPYDSGIALVRKADALKAAMAITAEYLPTDSPFRNPSDFTPELSRRARGVEVWAALRTLGRQGVCDLVERTCRNARLFAAGFRAAGFQVLNDVILNQVLISFGDPDTTNRIISDLQKEGTCWCGPTVWQGHTAMRISVSGWATTEADVERSLEVIIRIAKARSSS